MHGISFFLGAATLFASLAKADFLIANTTKCLGAFPLDQCYVGVQVISDGIGFNESFSCDKLYDAEDHRYVKKGTASKLSSNFTSNGDVCGAGKLFFKQDYDTPSANGTFDIFKGTDDSGDNVGKCVWDASSSRSCPMFLGRNFYFSGYRCTTSICGTEDDAEGGDTAGVGKRDVDSAVVHVRKLARRWLG